MDRPETIILTEYKPNPPNEPACIYVRTGYYPYDISGRKIITKEETLEVADSINVLRAVYRKITGNENHPKSDMNTALFAFSIDLSRTPEFSMSLLKLMVEQANAGLVAKDANKMLLYSLVKTINDLRGEVAELKEKMKVLERPAE